MQVLHQHNCAPFVRCKLLHALVPPHPSLASFTHDRLLTFPVHCHVHGLLMTAYPGGAPAGRLHAHHRFGRPHAVSVGHGTGAAGAGMQGPQGQREVREHPLPEPPYLCLRYAPHPSACRRLDLVCAEAPSAQQRAGMQGSANKLHASSHICKQRLIISFASASAYSRKCRLNQDLLAYGQSSWSGRLLACTAQCGACRRQGRSPHGVGFAQPLW